MSDDGACLISHHTGLESRNGTRFKLLFRDFPQAQVVRTGIMATPQHAILACCGSVGQCCGTIAGVWYLCLAILVLILLISCNDLLMSRCYFIGLPWSKMKLYYVHEIICDEVLLVLPQEDRNGSSVERMNKPPPPPPYSAI